MRPQTAAALVVILSTLLVANAGAQVDLEPSVVFFELYNRGEASSKTPEYAQAIQEDIGQYKQYSLLSREDAFARIRTTMVMPAGRINDERLAAIELLVAEGDKLLYTNPTRAIEVLHQAKLQLKEIVENISLDGKIRREYFTTEMLLVRSYLDNGNEPKAREIMAEIVRTFEDEYPVTEENYHPRVVDLYKSVFLELKDQRNATLAITSNPPGCDVFINGRAMRQKTPFTFQSLYPGSIRVNVRKGELQSMVRKVDVPANGSGKIDVDLEYESALSFSEETFGLTFTDRAAMTTNMLNYAVKLGAFLEVDYVVLTGVLRKGEEYVLAGYQVDVRGRRVVRQQDFVVKPNVVSNRRISEMAAFLADVKPGERTIVYKPWYTNWIGWSAAGVGLAMGGISLAFYLKFLEHRDNAQNDSFGSHEDRVDQANQGNDAQLTGGIFAGLAGAFIVSSALVFTFVKFEDESASASANETGFGPSSRPPSFVTTPVLLPGGAGFSAQWNF